MRRSFHHRFLGTILTALAVLLGSIAGLPAAAQAQSAAPAINYRLNPGDTLEIHVWGEDQLQRATRVMPDGTIAMPLVGTISAAGRTVQEIEAEIVEKLRPSYRTAVPAVTVVVSAVDGLRFYVLGKVTAPGSFAVGTYVNILQALALAGGPAQFAKVNDIQIFRQTGTGQVTIPFNYDRVVDGRAPIPPELARLQSGDVVVVP